MRRLLTRLVWPDAVPFTAATRVVAHEWITSAAGSDRVAAVLARVAGADVVYVFALDDDCRREVGFGCPVVTWRFGRQVARVSAFHLLVPLMPIVWWCLDLRRAQLVVTSSHSCVNSVRTPGAHRVSYCHTPMRYAWDWRLERRRAGRLVGAVLPLAAAVFRRLDRRWSRRVDEYVANSMFVAGRIRRAYDRHAVVVPPPIDVERWQPVAERADEFVVAGRLVAYKQPDVAVRAAAIADAPLVVAGSGPMLDGLRREAGPSTRFVEHPRPAELRDVVASGRALLFCGIEDFGMLPLEANAAGVPVIARAAGGALETVVDGVTGVLVDSDDPEVWAGVLRTFDGSEFDRHAMRRHAERFATATFVAAIAPMVGR